MFVQPFDGQLRPALRKETRVARVLRSGGTAGKTVFVVERQGEPESLGLLQRRAIHREILVAQIRREETLSKGQDAESAIATAVPGLAHLFFHRLDRDPGIVPEPQRPRPVALGRIGEVLAQARRRVGGGPGLHCAASGAAVEVSVLVKPERVHGDEPIPLDSVASLLVIDVPPLTRRILHRAAVAGTEQTFRTPDDGIVCRACKRSQWTVRCGVTDRVIRRVGPRTAVEQVVAALAFDHPRSLGHVTGPLLPLGLRLQNQLGFACGFRRAGHRLHRDAEAGQLDEVEVEFRVVIAEEVRIDGVIEELPAQGERAERAVRLGDAYRLVDGVIEIETPRIRIAPDVGRPDVRLAGLEHHGAALPIHEVGRGINPRAMVAVHFPGSIEVIHAVVPDHGGVGQVARDDRVLVGRRRRGDGERQHHGGQGEQQGASGRGPWLHDSTRSGFTSRRAPPSAVDHQTLSRRSPLPGFSNGPAVGFALLRFLPKKSVSIFSGEPSAFS